MPTQKEKDLLSAIEKDLELQPLGGAIRELVHAQDMFDRAVQRLSLLQRQRLSTLASQYGVNNITIKVYR